MKKNDVLAMLAAGAMLGFGMTLAGCETKDTNKAEEAADKAGDAAKDAGDSAGDAADKATDAAGDVTGG